MGLFEVCANIDPTRTVLVVRDSSGEVVHRLEKPPRWGLLPEGSIDFAALESTLLTLGYRRGPNADWVTGHWSAHTRAESAPESRITRADSEVCEERRRPRRGDRAGQRFDRSVCRPGLLPPVTIDTGRRRQDK